MYHPITIDKNIHYPIRITSQSQTIIDCFYNINLCSGLEELMYTLTEIDPLDIQDEDMLHCLKSYNSKSLYQRTGSLHLSDSFFDTCKANIGKNSSYLINPYYCDSFSKKWSLCIPDNLMKQKTKRYVLQNLNIADTSNLIEFIIGILPVHPP